MKRIIFSLLTAAICNASSLFAQQTEKTITIQTNGQEDVIDLPEGMITTTDSLYLDWISKHYINPAENCTMTTQNPEVSDSIYMDRLQRIPRSGEKLEWNSFVFEIMDMDGARIDKVLVTRSVG